MSVTKPSPSNKAKFPSNSVLPLPSRSAKASPSAAASQEVVVTPSPEATTNVCVDANALEHLESEELVFSTHYLAKVLCDANNSCATAGHMVELRGRVMMMKTYCANVGCTEREMLVNSPKYQRGRRVKSNTEGLRYTALAARYSSRAEEIVLIAATRIGM